MVKSKRLEKAQAAAQVEIHDLLRSAGRNFEFNSNDMTDLVEQISQAVGLNHRRTTRVLAIVRRLTATMEKIKVGDEIVVNGKWARVTKVDGNDVFYQHSEKSKTDRTKKNQLSIYPSVYCCPKSSMTPKVKE